MSQPETGHQTERGAAPGEPAGAAFARGEPTAAELRAQMALLAEQVRQLANGADRPSDPPGESVERTQPADAPPGPRAPTTVDRQASSAPAQPFPQPSVSAAPPPDADADADEDERLADRRDRVLANVLEMAALAAEQIRASARSEAANIRAQAAERLASPAGDAITELGRQRETLVTLAIEADRVEQATAVLQAQIRELDAERRRIHDALAVGLGARQP